MASLGRKILLAVVAFSVPFFARSTWVQEGADIDGEAQKDFSGSVVSMSSDGQTVAIGAKNNDGNGSNSGHVRVYKWSGTAWDKMGSDIDGESEGDYSGWSVSISSDGLTVAIGAINNDGNGSNSGHVRVYEWSGTAWDQKGADIDGEAQGDQSNFVSISSDGETVAVGAPSNGGNGPASGHVRVYKWEVPPVPAPTGSPTPQPTAEPTPDPTNCRAHT